MELISDEKQKRTSISRELSWDDMTFMVKSHPIGKQLNELKSKRIILEKVNPKKIG